MVEKAKRAQEQQQRRQKCAPIRLKKQRKEKAATPKKRPWRRFQLDPAQASFDVDWVTELRIEGLQIQSKNFDKKSRIFDVVVFV